MNSALSPPAIEHGVVDRPVVAAADEDGLAGGSHLLALAHVHEGQGPRVVHGGPQVHGQSRRPQRSPETDRLAQQPPAVDRVAPRRRHDRWIVARLHPVTLPRSQDAGATGFRGPRGPGAGAWTTS